uniref:Piezo-type mechanosensitive ion channel component n=1 Tax=Meloidogyne hapla TaxID=6305 RepID=A0A1I8B460_MELHA
MSSGQQEVHHISPNQQEQTTSFNIPSIHSTTNQEENNRSIACLSFLKRISDVFIVCLICFVGILDPSLLNLPYFLFFLTILTWLALYTPLRRQKFNFLKGAVLLYIILHFLVLITYQWTKDGTRSRCLTTIDHSSRGQGGGDDESLHDELLLNSAGNDSVDIIALQRITSHVMDREKIKKLIKSRRKTISGAAAATLVLTLQEITYLFLYHCYVFALLSMLVWALLYHSIIGLIFLVLACFLWALVDSRKWCFRLSPLILAYVELLLIAQYIYNMDLQKELKNDDLLEIIGFKYEENKVEAFVTILIKLLLSLPFFALSRLNLREIRYNSLSTQDRLKQIKNYGTFDESIEGVKFVDERKEISFRFFRNTIFAFLTLLIIYSSLVLISIYCYQFPSVPEFLKKLTGLDDKLSEEIGLQKYEGEDFGVLFFRLIKLISLIIVTMLQLKFFHDPWSKLVRTPSDVSHADIEIIACRVEQEEGNRT